MIIPTLPSEWANYAAIRSPVLAIPNADGVHATALAMTSKNGTSGFPPVTAALTASIPQWRKCGLSTIKAS